MIRQVVNKPTVYLECLNHLTLWQTNKELEGIIFDFFLASKPCFQISEFNLVTTVLVLVIGMMSNTQIVIKKSYCYY